MNTFELKTTIQFGEDALGFIGGQKGKKVFLVTDPFMIQSGLVDLVTGYLKDTEYKIFSDIVPDPPMELVVKGVDEMIGYCPDTVIALGGGSAIDAAKAILHFSREIGKLPAIKLIAIPTTSGTGSEVTSFSVITDSAKGVKYPLVSEALLPDIAILDSRLVESVPPAITADTGMDVLTHAIEAYVSTAATDFTDALAEKAVEMVFTYLKVSYQNKENNMAREKMHTASCMAGIAFNMASLGLNHAIAHNIGGKLHIPHGRTNAILLPYVIWYNAQIGQYGQKDYGKAATKYAELAKRAAIGGGNVRMCVKNLIHEIIKLEKEMKMPLSLEECNVPIGEIKAVMEEIAEGALKDNCIGTNPRTAKKKDIIDILQQAAERGHQTWI